MPRIELDPSLIGGGNAINAFQNAYNNGLKMQASQQELDDNQFKMDALRNEQGQQNALAKLMSSQGFDATTQQGQAQMYGAGGVKNTQGYLKSAADIGKVTAETASKTADARKADIENSVKRLELIGQFLGGSTDQATHTQMRAQMAANPELAEVAKMIPEQYNPNAVAMFKKISMPEKDRLAAEHQQLTLAETGRHNLAGEKINVDNNIRTNETSRLNNRDTILNSRESAKMVDTRTREFNATKVDENNLKRESKDDANNLTKQSQLASFDTMLGTLDRLGKHPGLGRSVGVVGMLPTMPGSDSANFQAELNTFQSQAFLPMVAQLKGMGALSDSEGKKLTAAVGALDPKMGEKAFRDSVARITDEMAAAKNRVSGGGKPVANQDSAAMTWAKANPQDPRAAKILKHLGQ